MNWVGARVGAEMGLESQGLGGFSISVSFLQELSGDLSDVTATQAAKSS